MELMHYTAEPITLDRDRTYEQEQPSMYTKPTGFWVSVLGEDDWPSWCTSEDFRADALEAVHRVTLADTANILYLTETDDLPRFQSKYDAPDRWSWSKRRAVDWQRVAADYDGIVIAPYRWEHRLGSDCSDWYYTWDCASGCIWNLAAIESVSAMEPAEADYDETDDLSAVLIGRKIVAAEMPVDTSHISSQSGWGSFSGSGEPGLLTLDDGTRVYVVGHDGGCACSAGCYDLTRLATVDNIITDVNVVDESRGDDDPYDPDEVGRWSIFVITDNEQINVAEFEGDDGNGYYGTGFHVAVVAAEADQ